MRRFLTFLLAAAMLLSLAACGKGGDPSASGGAGSAGSAASTSQKDPNTTPEPEPYVISDPKVMPEGGSKDGVTYVACERHRGAPLLPPGGGLSRAGL